MRAKTRDLLRRIRGPGGISTIVGALKFVWARASDADLANTVAGWLGVDMRVITAIAQSVWLPVIMMFVGIAYMAIDRPKLADRHHYVPFLGWSFVVISGALALSTLMFSQIISGTKFSEVSQFYIEAHTQRRLLGSDRERFIKALSSISTAAPTIGVEAIMDDPETLQYADDIISALKETGIKPQGQRTIGNRIYPFMMLTTDPNERGLFVSVPDKKNPDDISAKLLTALKDAGLTVGYDESEGPMPFTPSIFVSHK